MADYTAPCCICGKETKDFGYGAAEYYNACPPCSEEIFTALHGHGSNFPNTPGGWQKPSPKVELIVKKILEERQTATKKSSEGSCRNCGKTNDTGVVSCWWCTCPNPVS